MAYTDKEKQRAAWRAYYHRNPEKHRQFSAMKRQQTQIWFAGIKAGYSCVICGENEPVCIDFHHLQHDEKSFNVADAIQNGYGRERILEEIGKCVALCANCHRKLHIGKVNLPEHVVEIE